MDAVTLPLSATEPGAHMFFQILKHLTKRGKPRTPRVVAIETMRRVRDYADICWAQSAQITRNDHRRIGGQLEALP
ncbi:MAG: hypothetical protein PHQ28_14110, partial [Mycobacterium sp.]|nr:hypothetical protein [Mycobacterium sp.]